MRHTRRLTLRFDSEALQRDLARIADDEWAPVPVPGVEGAIDDWRGLALRSYDGETRSVGYHGASYHDTPLLARVPYLAEVVRFFACETRRVRLLSLQPGAVIGTHRDALDVDGAEVVRIHVPIQTHERVSFRADGRDLVLRPGEVWVVDVSRPHSLSNHGETPRVHLVIDCVVNEWLRALLTRDAGG